MEKIEVRLACLYIAERLAPPIDDFVYIGKTPKDIPAFEKLAIELENFIYNGNFRSTNGIEA
uniref:Uncharacterized protein n=1 Tax=viral metagenome TaxID=1070528 RepID=A0A6M3KXC2_9ZZZZ